MANQWVCASCGEPWEPRIRFQGVRTSCGKCGGIARARQSEAQAIRQRFADLHPAGAPPMHYDAEETNRLMFFAEPAPEHRIPWGGQPGEGG